MAKSFEKTREIVVRQYGIRRRGSVQLTDSVGWMAAGPQKTFGKMHRSACAHHSALHYGQNWYFVSKIVLTTGTVWGNLRGSCR